MRKGTIFFKGVLKEPVKSGNLMIQEKKCLFAEIKTLGQQMVLVVQINLVLSKNIIFAIRKTTIRKTTKETIQQGDEIFGQDEYIFI